MQLSTAKRIITAITIAGVVLAGAVNFDKFEVGTLVAWIAGFGLFGPVVYILARSIGAIFFIPGSIMAIAAGVAFGPVWGAVYNLLASTIGAILAFLVARYVASDFVREKLAKRGWLAKLIKGVEDEGWRFVAFVRLVPLFPYNLLNYALGLTRIKISHYAVASFICMIPADIVYVYIGYAGREAMSGNKASIEIALMALGLLAAIVFLPRFLPRMRRYFKARKLTR